MAIDGSYYINRNGKVQKGRINDENVDSIFNSIPTFNSMLEDMFLGSGSHLDDFLRLTPPKTNRLSCTGVFPPNSKYVDPETKELHIDIAACGVNEDEFKAEIDDNKIIVSFGRKENKDKVYDYKGLKLVTDEVLTFTFDPRFHDAATARCDLKNGLLSIVIEPRPEVKPTKKLLGGALKIEEKDPAEDDTKEEGKED